MNAEHAAAGQVLTLRPPPNWPEQPGPIVWSLRSEAGVAEGECAGLEALPARARGAEVRLWSPAAATLLLETRLPPMSRSRAVKALPFSVEERLIDDPADLHFAHVELPDGGILVGITRTSVLTLWIEALHAARLAPKVVCPGVLSLPIRESAWSVRRDGECLLVRTTPFTGRAMRWSAVPPYLLLSMLNEARAYNRAPERILIYGSALDFDCEGWTRKLGVTVEAQAAGAAETEAPINLLQGPFSPSWELPTLAARLVPAVIMLAVWAAGGVGAAGWRWRRLASVERRQTKEMTSLLRQAFPEIKKSHDPAGQMTRELAALRARGGRLSPGDLLPLLDGLARGLASVPNVQLRALEYGEAAIEATVLASELASIEQLKQICAGSGLGLDIASATQSDGKTQARLRVFEGGRHATR